MLEYFKIVKEGDVLVLFCFNAGVSVGGLCLNVDHSRLHTHTFVDPRTCLYLPFLTRLFLYAKAKRVRPPFVKTFGSLFFIVFGVKLYTRSTNSCMLGLNIDQFVLQLHNCDFCHPVVDKSTGELYCNQL